MTHPNKAKGASFERAVADYLADHGHPNADRAYGAGRTDDRGDIAGVDGFAIQCKNVQRIELAAFIDEAQEQALNRRVDNAAVVVKRRGKHVAHAYVVLDLATFAAITATDDPRPVIDVESTVRPTTPENRP